MGKKNKFNSEGVFTFLQKSLLFVTELKWKGIAVRVITQIQTTKSIRWYFENQRKIQYGNIFIGMSF